MSSVKFSNSVPAVVFVVNSKNVPFRILVNIYFYFNSSVIKTKFIRFAQEANFYKKCCENIYSSILVLHTYIHINLMNSINVDLQNFGKMGSIVADPN